MRFRWAVLAVAISSLLIGCGGGGASNASKPATSGADVFAGAGCENCHTLKAAGATGMVGPDLDDLKPAEATVAHQVTNGGGGMPSFRGTLSPAQITAVAQYVSANAGR